MKIIISGYGRMGKSVEEVCLQRGHEIAAILDTPVDWEKKTLPLQDAVVIDFSMPEVAADNILRCFRLGLPVVCGTTGWYNRLEQVTKACAKSNGALFYAPNFSLGVNILFHVNRLLAGIMASAEGYRATISETHHIHKLDAPSGTALRLAEDILNKNPKLKRWENKANEVVYDSPEDSLVLKHEAKNRTGFAVGAVLAAEFIQNKKGVFTMDDYLKTLWG